MHAVAIFGLIALFLIFATVILYCILSIFFITGRSDNKYCFIYCMRGVYITRFV